MQKTSIILMIIILGFLTVILSSSGCINTNQTTSTFGEKKIDLNLIKVVNNSSGNYDWNDTNYFYVEGNLSNFNPIDALQVKINATFFDANGSEVTTNQKLYVYLEPKSIPSKGKSYFYIEIPDQKQEIVDFKINVISAKAEL